MASDSSSENKRGAAQQQESEKDAGTPPATPSEKKKRRSNLFLRVGERIGVVEQTRIAPEFMSEIEKYFKYYDVADNLVDGIEGVLQKNPKILATSKIEAPERMDPYEQLARLVKALGLLYESDAQPFKMMCVVSDLFRQQSVHHREVQLLGRRTIRKLRRFVSKDHMQMLEEQRKLMQARDVMDSARHDLKKTTTKDEVEQFGKIYEETVHEFDVQAAKVEAFTLALPQNKMHHHREIFELFDVLAKHHRAMASLLDTQLTAAMLLVPSEFVTRPSGSKFKFKPGKK